MKGFAERFGPPTPTGLPFDLILVPLDEDRLDTLATSEEHSIDGFTYLTPKMATEIGQAIGAGRAIYIETDYFGGMGGQAAALFENGLLAWKRADSNFEREERKPLLGRLTSAFSKRKKSPISEGLSHLGVVAESGQDEFDAVGLHRFRSLDVFDFEFEDD